MSRHTCDIVRDGPLGICQGVTTHVAVLWHCMWCKGPRGNNATCSTLSQLSVTSPATHKQIGPFWCWFPDGWVCVHSRTLQVSPKNSPMRLGVSATTATPTGFFFLIFHLNPNSQRFWGFLFPFWNPGLCGLSCSAVVPHKRGTTSCHLVTCLLHTGRPSPLVLPVWINVSSLTPGLSDFHTAQFSGSSHCFLFLIFSLPFFWLCKEAKCIYLPLHLGQKSLILLF